MPAPKGNQFWKLVRNPTGRPKKYETAEQIWDKVCEYFAWCDENPLESYEIESSTKEVKEKIKNHKRVYTLEGVWLYLGISEQTFINYGRKDDCKEFFEVIKTIRDIVYRQKFEGATAGLFNSNIIARDLGLKDKQDVTTDGESIKQKTVFKIGGQEIEIE